MFHLFHLIVLSSAQNSFPLFTNQQDFADFLWTEAFNPRVFFSYAEGATCCSAHYGQNIWNNLIYSSRFHKASYLHFWNWNNFFHFPTDNNGGDWTKVLIWGRSRILMKFCLTLHIKCILNLILIKFESLLRCQCFHSFDPNLHSINYANSMKLCQLIFKYLKRILMIFSYIQTHN